jgi:hypothetical protein
VSGYLLKYGTVHCGTACVCSVRHQSFRDMVSSSDPPAEFALLNTKETINSGSAESAVAALPAIDNIADEDEDSGDEEYFRSA